MTKKELKFQKELVKELRSGEEGAYEETSVYTVLFDLSEGNGITDVFMILHQLATDLGERQILEDSFEEAKNWAWT